MENIIYFSFLPLASSWKAVHIYLTLKKKKEPKENDILSRLKVSESKGEVLLHWSQTTWFAK